jgi:catechol 2,3-dioxygenase-like lactoylglutathione lyase family enzyme
MSDIPALNGLIETALYVDDVGRSVEFYRTVLGFDVIAYDERLTAVGVAGRQLLLICDRKASSRLPLGAHEGQGRQHIAFAVDRNDLDAWQARLAHHRVTIELTRYWPRGGRSLYFRDPDDHLIELASPGVWPSIY